MNEYPSDSSELDDKSEAEIEHLMDVRGISHSEAQELLGFGNTISTGFIPPEYRRVSPPPRHYQKYESRRDGDTFDVIDTDLSEKELADKARGVAMLRAALDAKRGPLSNHDRAVDRARHHRNQLNS